MLSMISNASSHQENVWVMPTISIIPVEIDTEMSMNESLFNTSILSKLSRVEENPTVTRLLNNTSPVLEETLCLNVLELFQQQPSLFAIPVT
jgi:hypothetical protein